MVEVMLTEFTFISVSYNQEIFIIEHLNSIKEQIIRYGKNIKVSLVLADDCSKDSTVPLAKDWIKENEQLFDQVNLIANEVNLGSVKNIYNAIDYCVTEDFKILACDDRYNESSNIFELYEKGINDVIITPIIPISNDSQEAKKYICGIERNFDLVKYYANKNKLNIMLSIQNYLMAPGVFIPCKYWRDEEIKKEILNFKYIEDYPMWVNLIIKRNIHASVLEKAYVNYRLSLSTRKIDNKNVDDIRKDDNDMLKKLYSFKVDEIERLKYKVIKGILTLKHKIA